MGRGRQLFVAVSLLVLVLDQATKLLMTRWLAPRGSAQVIPGFFDLSYVMNSGAVFGLFRDLASPWRHALLVAIPMVAVVFVLVLALNTPSQRLRPLLALGMVLGGAAGNLLDRVRLNAVVDFLDVYIGRHHWPAFNLADSAICTGVGLLLLDLWRTPTAGGAESAGS